MNRENIKKISRLGYVSTKVLHEFIKTLEVSILLGFFFVYRFKEVSKKFQRSYLLSKKFKEVNYLYELFE
jgi:hypothetical protein